MPSLMCRIDTCKHNENRHCTRKTVSISWHCGNDFDRGHRVYYPACEDCEEVETEDMANEDY